MISITSFFIKKHKIFNNILLNKVKIFSLEQLNLISK